MYELLLNRNAGCSFVRFMADKCGTHIVEHSGTPDRNDVRLILTETQFALLGGFLQRNSHRIENADVILAGMGKF